MVDSSEENVNFCKEVERGKKLTLFVKTIKHCGQQVEP